ncbi:MAG: PD-(D/E)XK nuclease family transposase [Dorea sp.]|jgi:predicted transposase/invertase (TIGR01784 family)|nr:MAG TPA: PD-(D/E)XK nuclease family transposase [Caudoviricetes sp.]
MTEKLNSSNLRQNPRNVNELVNELTLFDDDLMSRVFDKNIKATELLLRIILGKKVKVISVTGQNEMKNHQVGRRNITLDVDAMDENGEEIDIEVQGNSEGAHVRRARYHSSMVDSRMLKEGQAFRELKDSYVIFIYKHDKFRKGLPLYHVERYVGETNEQFRDGSHIIYVNGNYKGNDEIGQLMQDFREKNPECMHYTELAESVKHFKEKEGGREEMSEIVERYINERVEERVKECVEERVKECVEERVKERVEKEKTISVQNLMNNMKWTLDQALDALGIKGKERTLITQQLQK